MMEESSDESGEMITKEEAEVAELEQNNPAPSSITQSSIAPPAPLPSFLTQTSPGGLQPAQGIPQVAPSVPMTTPQSVPQLSPQTVPLTSAATAMTPGSKQQFQDSSQLGSIQQVQTPSKAGLTPGLTQQFQDSSQLGSIQQVQTPSKAGLTPGLTQQFQDSSQLGSIQQVQTPNKAGLTTGLTQQFQAPSLTQQVQALQLSQQVPDPSLTQKIPDAGLSQPAQTPAFQQQVQAPGPIERPIDVSSAIQIPEVEMTPIGPQSPEQKGGLFGWFSGNKMISKVVEKTKNSMENMITIIDPGMKEVIRTGGDVFIVVTSTSESKVGAVREAFQQTFGKAIVMAKESQATTAAQPVGFTAGLKGAEERIQNLRQSGNVDEKQAIVSVEGFIIEMLPDRWYEMSCLVLQDPVHRIDLQTFSQPSPIPAEYILKAQDRTPTDYPLRWLGLAVTIGQVIEESMPHIGHTDWQNGIVGVSRRESLLLAAKSLAYMYKQRLPTAFVS